MNDNLKLAYSAEVASATKAGKTSNLKLDRPIMFCGGGTLGAVVPLLAVVEEIKKLSPERELVWVGTDTPQIKEVVESYGIKFETLPVVKADRFWSLQNLAVPFNFIRVLVKAARLLDKYFPETIVNAGSFTGVPLIWLGKVFGCRVIIHQQDRVPSLSNQLTGYLANVVTVAFSDMKHIFTPKIGIYLGNPIRQSLLDAVAKFKIQNLKFKILVMGGSSGALGLNEKIKMCLPQLLEKFQVIHLTGRGKGVDFKNENYQQEEFVFDGLARFYAEAEVVISRCGLNAITELSALKKKTIFVPLPDSHQGANAQWLAQNGAVVLRQAEITSEILLKKIGEALESASPKWWEFYQLDAAHKLAEIVLESK